MGVSECTQRRLDVGPQTAATAAAAPSAPPITVTAVLAGGPAAAQSAALQGCGLLAPSQT